MMWDKLLELFILICIIILVLPLFFLWGLDLILPLDIPFGFKQYLGSVFVLLAIRGFK